MSAEAVECSLPMDVDNAGANKDGRYEDSEEVDEPLDPRVGPELERLNAAAEAVNKYEIELTQGKTEINKRMHEIVSQLKGIAEQVGSGRIEQARDYYDTLAQSDIVKQQLLEASMAYKAAAGRCEVAKEMLRIAEQSFMERVAQDASSAYLDYTFQEMLNHATETVVHAETERTECDKRICELTSRTAEIENRLNVIRRQHPRSIERTAVYFEYRTRIDAELKEKRRHCEEIALYLRRAKTEYRRALRRLDEISNEIHASRVAAGRVTAQTSKGNDQPIEVDGLQSDPVDKTSSNINTDANSSQNEQQNKQSVAIETAVQSARTLVESASRNRKLRSSTSIVPTSPKAESDSQSVDRSVFDSVSSMAIGAKNDDMLGEFTADDEPDAFRNEIERSRWRRIDPTSQLHSPLPINGDSAGASAATSADIADSGDTQSDSSSVASLPLDVAFEKLVLGDELRKPQTLAPDALTAASRSSSYEHAIANADQAQSMLACHLLDDSHPAQDVWHESQSHSQLPIGDRFEPETATNVRRSVSCSSGVSISVSSLAASDRGNLFAKRVAVTGGDPLRETAFSNDLDKSESGSESEFEAVETTV